MSFMGDQLSLFVKSDQNDLAQDRKELLPSEIIQAEQRFGEDKLNRFIISRAFLRRTLGSMLGPDWCRAPICLSPLGKPYVPALAHQLWFNLSHTKDIMCVVFSRRFDIGVDIESAYRVVPNALKRFSFSEAEQQQAMRCSDSNGEYLHYWVAKEAVLKCIGCGLNHALQSIQVERSSNGAVWAQDMSVSCPSPRYFRLLGLPCIPGFIGYVAVPVSASMLPISQQPSMRNSNYQWRLE